MTPPNNKGINEQQQTQLSRMTNIHYNDSDEDYDNNIVRYDPNRHHHLRSNLGYISSPLDPSQPATNNVIYQRPPFIPDYGRDQYFHASDHRNPCPYGHPETLQHVRNIGSSSTPQSPVPYVYTNVHNGESPSHAYGNSPNNRQYPFEHILDNHSLQLLPPQEYDVIQQRRPLQSDTGNDKESQKQGRQYDSESINNMVQQGNRLRWKHPELLFESPPETMWATPGEKSFSDSKQSYLWGGNSTITEILQLFGHPHYRKPIREQRLKTLPSGEMLPRHKELGGYIFLCSTESLQEHINMKLFGLPARYKDSVRVIKPGLPLFLFNFTTHKLHGIFKAASFGGFDLEPRAWEDTKSTTGPTSKYPAQVRVSIGDEIQELHEEVFRYALTHYDGPKFKLALSVPQTLDILALFDEQKVHPKIGTFYYLYKGGWEADMNGSKEMNQL